MIDIEKSSGNVYEDLQTKNADVMHVKACLASKIGEIIQNRNMTQQQASEVLGISQPKLSGLLRGHFRGISETKMIECLNRLGSNIEIVIHESNNDHSLGYTEVVFA